MDVSINGLKVIVCSGIDDETIVGMDISSFAGSMVSGADAPCRVSARRAEVTAIISL